MLQLRCQKCGLGVAVSVEDSLKTVKCTHCSSPVPVPDLRKRLPPPPSKILASPLPAKTAGSPPPSKVAAPLSSPLAATSGTGKNTGGSRHIAFRHGGLTAVGLLAAALLVGFIHFVHGTWQNQPSAEAPVPLAAKPEKAEDGTAAKPTEKPAGDPSSAKLAPEKTVNEPADSKNAPASAPEQRQLTADNSAARADVAAYRTGRIDPRVNEVPAEIQTGVFAQPQRQIKPLVRWLIQNTNDDFQKVKILHDWIADNIAYDVDSYRDGVQIDSAWESTLRRRKSVCQGYAELMAQMCQLVGIRCEVVPGHARGCDFVLGNSENPHDVDHSWNAVQVKGRWYLLDVTWDAGNVERRSFNKQYSTEYLFLEARAFLHTHFPSDPRWQLLDRACTAEEFIQLPYLPGRFFEQGLRLATSIRRHHVVRDSIQFTIASPPDVAVIAQLVSSYAACAEKLEGRTLVQRDGAHSNILVTFPKAGQWNVKILSKKCRDPGMFWQAAILEFKSSGGTPQTFPETYSVDGIDAYLFSPLSVPLEIGKPQEFSIRVRGAKKVFLKIGIDTFLPMKPTMADPDLQQLVATVPANTSVQIVAEVPGKDEFNWKSLVDFCPEKKNGS